MILKYSREDLSETKECFPVKLLSLKVLLAAIGLYFCYVDEVVIHRYVCNFVGLSNRN